MMVSMRRREPCLAALVDGAQHVALGDDAGLARGARTNTLLMRFSISSRTASRTVVSGAAKTGGALMTSRTRWR